MQFIMKARHQDCWVLEILLKLLQEFTYIFRLIICRIYGNLKLDLLIYSSETSITFKPSINNPKYTGIFDIPLATLIVLTSDASKLQNLHSTHVWLITSNFNIQLNYIFVLKYWTRNLSLICIIFKQ